MVKERLKLEKEIQDIFNECVDKSQNFLLSGGAGSGKTTSLVEVIRQAIAENPMVKIACITYTNSAVDVIKERVDSDNLFVSTIHDFLWDNIKIFQKDIKLALIELLNSGDIKKPNDIDIMPNDFFEGLESGIQYKEYKKIKEGIISHDEVLILANYLFKNHQKLNTIVKDKYPFILIDEYQDTNKLVIEILLKHFKKSDKKCVIGFFGDAMQAIYDDGVGNLNDYKSDITEIKIEKNFRNPIKIIELANKLRTDGIQQQQGKDNGEGNILFLYSNGDDWNNGVNLSREYLTNYGWNFVPNETKELNLTHNLIAGKAGFKSLLDIYDRDPIIRLKNRTESILNRDGVLVDNLETFDSVISRINPSDRREIIETNSNLYDVVKASPFSEISKFYFSKDNLLDYRKQNGKNKNKILLKTDNLIKHLFKIQDNISLYEKGEYIEFIRKTDFKIKSIDNKKKIKASIEEIKNNSGKTIGNILDLADENGICKKDDNLRMFETKEWYLYNRVRSVNYSEFENLYRYLEEETPFSTQHKVKGNEFNNIFIILDNGRWFNYNFKSLLSDDRSNLDVYDRTLKLFYVCCTRSMKNLAMFYNKPTEKILNKAKELFNEDSIINLD